MKALAESPTPVQLPLAERYAGRRYVKLVLVLGALCGIGPLTMDTVRAAGPDRTCRTGAALLFGSGSTSGRGPYRIVSAIATGFWR